MAATTSRMSASRVASRRLDRDTFDTLTLAKGAPTMEEKAILIGVHRATIFRWFDEFRGSLSQAEEVARLLDTDIDSLFPVVGDESSKAA